MALILHTALLSHYKSLRQPCHHIYSHFIICNYRFGFCSLFDALINSVITDLLLTYLSKSLQITDGLYTDVP